MTFWLRFGLIAFAAIACFMAGNKVARMACKAEQAEALQKAVEARKVDESFTQGVSAAYEGVAAQLRRLSAVNRVELTREVTKEVYRCPLPADALRMLNAGIDSANNATGQPDATVPPTTPPDSQRPGRTGSGLFGTDGDIR